MRTGRRGVDAVARLRNFTVADVIPSIVGVFRHRTAGVVNAATSAHLRVLVHQTLLKHEGEDYEYCEDTAERQPNSALTPTTSIALRPSFCANLRSGHTPSPLRARCRHPLFAGIAALHRNRF